MDYFEIQYAKLSLKSAAFLLIRVVKAGYWGANSLVWSVASDISRFHLSGPAHPFSWKKVCVLSPSFSSESSTENYLATVNRLIQNFPVENEGVFILKDLQEDANEFDVVHGELGSEQQWQQVTDLSLAIYSRAPLQRTRFERNSPYYRW